MINKYSTAKTANIIKQTRKSMGKEYNQDKMAELLGLKHRQSYANVENGEIVPSFEQLCKLCNIFECDIGYLMGEYSTKTHIAADIQEVTGLSEKSIETLKYYNTDDIFSKQIINIINFLLDIKISKPPAEVAHLYTDNESKESFDYISKKRAKELKVLDLTNPIMLLSLLHDYFSMTIDKESTYTLINNKISDSDFGTMASAILPAEELVNSHYLLSIQNRLQALKEKYQNDIQNT